MCIFLQWFIDASINDLSATLMKFILESQFAAKNAKINK